MNIRQPSPGRGHTDGTTSRPKVLALVGDASEGEVQVQRPARKPGEQRVLFYKLSPAAAEALKAKAEGTRYEGADDISLELPDGEMIRGPLRTMDYHQHLCALQQTDDSIIFSAAGQKKRGVFYPLACSDDDPVAIALSTALAETG